MRAHACPSLRLAQTPEAGSIYTVVLPVLVRLGTESIIRQLSSVDDCKYF